MLDFCINLDSKVVIDWANGDTNFELLHIDQWDNRVRETINNFSYISFTHTYREFNYAVDGLSKFAVGDMDGILHFEELIDDNMVDVVSIYVF